MPHATQLLVQAARAHQENDTCFNFGVRGVLISANAFFGFIGLPLMALRSPALNNDLLL
jgi:hypothetical protein